MTAATILGRQRRARAKREPAVDNDQREPCTSATALTIVSVSLHPAPDEVADELHLRTALVGALRSFPDLDRSSHQ